MPASLPVNGLAAKLLDAGAGALQALLGAFVLPPIAKTVGKARLITGKPRTGSTFVVSDSKTPKR